jgi:hypothetical protein
MTKKTFKSVPRTSRQLGPEEIERFVHDGPGRDARSVDTDTQKAVQTDTQTTASTDTQKTSSTETQPSVDKEPTARLTVDLPQSVHHRFKAVCGLAGLRMNEEIRRFIEQRTAELEAEQRS